MKATASILFITPDIDCQTNIIWNISIFQTNLIFRLMHGVCNVCWNISFFMFSLLFIFGFLLKFISFQLILNMLKGVHNFYLSLSPNIYKSLFEWELLPQFCLLLPISIVGRISRETHLYFRRIWIFVLCTVCATHDGISVFSCFHWYLFLYSY